jgi:predicted nucleotidyltransferase
VKSNPPLFEWLDSGIVYLDRNGFAERLRACRDEFFSPPACAYHYLHMAQGNYRSYLKGDTVKLKKYFYVLRPLLAVRWIEQRRGMVPMLFRSLLDTVAGNQPLLDAVEALLVRKMAGDELAEGPPIPAIKDFVDAEMTRLEGWKPEEFRGKVDCLLLDELFRSMMFK